MEKSENLVSKFQSWTRRSVTLKLITIAVISLLLLIPQSQVSRLINERHGRLIEVENEVAQKWSGQQQLIGPYLSIPYTKEQIVVIEGEKTYRTEILRAFIFPEELHIGGELKGVPLKRGIFDIVVYQSVLKLEGFFLPDGLQKLGIAPETVIKDKIKVHFAFSDLRGLGDKPNVTINGLDLAAEPYYDNINHLSGLQVDVPPGMLTDSLIYSCKLQLKGSKSLYFSPLGKTTQVQLAGDWKDPSFQGNFLPVERDVSFSGFSASWRVLHFNRPYGQEFLGSLPQLDSSLLGLSLLMPVDQYQKSTRSSKFALIVIALSFLAMFLMELITKNKVHPFQYVLVGLALVLYYTLLIGFSEFIGFGYAYLVSSVATVGLLALYSLTFIKQKKSVGVFTALLGLFYVFIYVIIEQQERALLIGSIGLFLALAATMFASRKIQWYPEGEPDDKGDIS